LCINETYLLKPYAILSIVMLMLLFVFYSVRRQYPPFSLHELQRAIDVGRINPDEPIDLTTICNTKLFKLNPKENEFGIHLTDEVGDC